MVATAKFQPGATTTAATALQTGSQAAPAATPSIRLLGGFEVVTSGIALVLPQSSQRLLVYLALAGRAQNRAVIAGSLWPDKSDERAAANLRSALWRLTHYDSRTVAPPHEGVVLVDARGSMLSLAAPVEVDFRELERAGWALVRGEQDLDGIDPWRPSLYQELLPGWYDDWVLVERERLAQLRLHFLEALARNLRGVQRAAEALDVALRLVAADPLRERSRIVLVETYLAEGNRAAAVRQVEQYDALCRATFGCGPTSALAAALALD
ncbi:MAG: BTAD domain-containing putative transcriptional regulator [Acidimicrobiia bacterium]